MFVGGWLRPPQNRDRLAVHPSSDGFQGSVLNIDVGAELARPAAIGELTSRVGRHPFSCVEGYFFHTRFQFGASTWSVAERCKGHEEGIEGFFPRNGSRPIAIVRHRPPPACDDPGCPSNTVVVPSCGTGDAVVVRGQSRKDRAIGLVRERHGLVASPNKPRERPQSSQAAAIARKLPWASPAAGSSPVMARSASNQ